MNGQTEVVQAITFHGHDPLVKGSTAVDAAEFIREMGARAISYGWDAAEIMRRVRSSLKNEANDWFTDRLPFTKTDAEYTLICNDWEAFKKCFKLTYTIKEVISVVDWTDTAAQRKDEHVGAFNTRVFKTIKKFILTVNEVPQDPEPFVITPYEQVILDLVAAIADEPTRQVALAALRRNQDTNQANLIRHQQRKTVQLISRKMLIHGLKDKALQKQAHDYDRQLPLTDDFLRQLEETASREEKEAKPQNNHNNRNNHNNHNNHNNQNNRVFEVEETDSNNQEASGDVEAVRSNNKYTNNKSNSQKKQPDWKKKDLSVKCGYCKKQGHKESDCRRKKDDKHNGLTLTVASANNTKKEETIKSVAMGYRAFAGNERGEW